MFKSLESLVSNYIKKQTLLNHFIKLTNHIYENIFI